jgi:hypothetical protein
MEVIVIEHETFKRIEEMFAESQEIIREQAKLLTNAKLSWVNAKQAAEISGYNSQTLRSRKSEIGYRTMGKDIFFKLSDLEIWMDKYYRAPRTRK